MKRGGKLARNVALTAKTPLAAGKPLLRSTPLAPGGPLRHALSTPLQVRRTVRVTGPGQGVRALVAARDGRKCVRCGKPATNTHHRTPRGAGGSTDPAIHSPANLLSVCGSGVTGCHGWIESHRREAEARGWIVRRPNSPAAIPVVIPGIGWVRLTADGKRVAL